MSVSPPVKVLAVTNIWPEGDSFRGIFVKEQIEALSRLGVSTDVEVVAQGRGKSDYLLGALRVRRRLREGDYDLVHIHYGMTAVAARLTGAVPKVLSLYGSDVNVGWQRAVTKLGLKGVAARVYVSENLRANAGDETGHVIADGVDFELFAPGDRDAARAAYGIRPGEKAILFGGHPSNHIKGYDVFCDVLKTLRARGADVRELVLAAPDQPRSVVPRKFDAADVLLFTSRKGSEGSPSVITEATVMNLPVVSVTVGDAARQLDGVTPSEVVDFPRPWGSETTRRELIETLADRTAEVLGTGLRSNGRERNAWLDSRLVARRTLELYHQVMGTSAGDPSGQSAGGRIDDRVPGDGGGASRGNSGGKMGRQGD